MTLCCINVRRLKSNEITPSLGGSVARTLGGPFSWSDGRRRVRRADSDTVTVLPAEGHQLGDSRDAMHYNCLVLLISTILCSVLVADSQTIQNRRSGSDLTFAEYVYITFSGACKYLTHILLVYNVYLTQALSLCKARRPVSNSGSSPNLYRFMMIIIISTCTEKSLPR